MEWVGLGAFLCRSLVKTSKLLMEWTTLPTLYTTSIFQVDNYTKNTPENPYLPPGLHAQLNWFADVEGLETIAEQHRCSLHFIVK